MTIDRSNPRRLISDAICQVAPDVEPSEIEDLDPDELLKDALELDSMDQLNVAAEIFRVTGVDIPERDYAQIETLGAFEVYLSERLAAADG